MNDSVSLKHKQTWQGKESKNTVGKKKKFKHIHYEPPRILNVILAVFICLSVPTSCRRNNTAKDTGVTKKGWRGIICEGPIRVVQKRLTWKYKACMKGEISRSSIIMQFREPTVPSLQTNTEHCNNKHLICIVEKYRESGVRCVTPWFSKVIRRFYTKNMAGKS